MKKTAIYLRVSTNEQAMFGYGLDAQEERCRIQTKLYDIDEKSIVIYKDDGYSAKNLKRPRLQALLKDVESGIIRSIIVYKLDRLTRNVVDTYNLLKYLTDNDCSLTAVLDHLDIGSANGRMFIGMLAIVAQWEREVISERTVDGLRAKLKKGEFPFNIPFGWKKSHETIELDPPAVKILEEMAQMVLDGYSLLEIKDRMNYKYSLNKTTDTIKKYMIRPMNIGLFYFQNECFDIFPSIMNIDVYSEIQEKILIRQHLAPNKRSYILHSLVYCSCGNKCSQESSKKKNKENKTTYYYYYCPSCKKRINQDSLFKQILPELILYSKKKDIVEQYDKAVQELNKLDSKIKIITNDFINDHIDSDVYESAIYELNEKKSKINQRIKFTSILNFERYYKLSLDEKRNWIRSIVSKIIVNCSNKQVMEVKYKKT